MQVQSLKVGVRVLCGGWGALKEIEAIVAFRELWEIKSLSLFIELRRPWELATLPGVGIVEITVLKAVDQVCGRPELNYALSLPIHRERRLREIDDCSLKGDGHRCMQVKMQEDQMKEASSWAGRSRETSWHTWWVCFIRSKRGSPGWSLSRGTLRCSRKYNVVIGRFRAVGGRPGQSSELGEGE